ncbi:LptA/OstA family protein [Sphingomonas sp.]|uniref:LptA/OstA family protein n=1 Tax=Sphingomonas sp. TaxID=28214 RepID=UPI002C88A499|nr:LptA/OstA family protein [Sphingomonas sp.]HTG38999.1 LptA/OstA family protein [Sphingomonas sp.]
MTRALAPLALMLLGGTTLPGAAMAQSHNSNAPIDFAANAIELQDRANRAVLSGGVNIRQANMTLTADRVTVAYTGQVIGGSPQVSRLDASGGVTLVRPDQRARAQYGVYDLNRRVVTMLGGVSLTQGTNTVTGGRLSINLDTGRAVIDGSAVGGGAAGAAADNGVTRQSGRVTGRFTVPSRQ